MLEKRPKNNTKTTKKLKKPNRNYSKWYSACLESSKYYFSKKDFDKADFYKKKAEAYRLLLGN